MFDSTAVSITSAELVAAGAQVGDLVVFYACVNGNNTASRGGSTAGIDFTGFSSKSVAAGGSPVPRLTYWVGVVTGTLSGTHVISDGGGPQLLANAAIFRGADPVKAVAQASTSEHNSGTSQGTWATPGHTTTVENSLLVAIFGGNNDNNANGSPFSGVSAGWTLRQSTGHLNSIALGVATRPCTAPGPQPLTISQGASFATVPLAFMEIGGPLA